MRLGVAEQATPQVALETLRQVAQIYSNADDGYQQALERTRIWEAYQTLAEADFARDGGTEALQEFRAEGSLLGEDFGFYACKDLVAPDDRELAALFRDKSAATFLWLPEGHADAAEVARAVSLLLDLPRVSKARRSVSFDELPAEGECERVASRFHAIRRDLLGYIRKVARSRFDALVESGEAAILAGAPLRFAASIQVRYTLGSRTITDPRSPALAFDMKGIVVRADRCETLLDLGDDLEDALDVQGLACAFHTLITVPPGQRAAHAGRQGYLVPEEEWASLGVSQATPPIIKPPDGSDDGDPEPVAVKPEPNGTHRAGEPDHTPPPERVEGITVTAGPNGIPHGTATVTPGDPGLIDRPKSPPVTRPPRPGGPGRPRDWSPPVAGREYTEPKRLRSPRASNARLVERLGTAPRRREAREYLKGPEEPPALVADPDEPAPIRIRTLLYAVNLENGFLRFAPADLRLFEPEWPSEIELIGDDDDRARVAVDYRAGILHGKDLTAFLEIRHDWPYGTILWLDATSVPGATTFTPNPWRSRPTSGPSSTSTSTTTPSPWSLPAARNHSL